MLAALSSTTGSSAVNLPYGHQHTLTRTTKPAVTAKSSLPRWNPAFDRRRVACRRSRAVDPSEVDPSWIASPASRDGATRGITMREDIEFDAEGATLRGWFYRPDGVVRRGAVRRHDARVFGHQGDASRRLRRGVQRRRLGLRRLRQPGLRRLGHRSGPAPAGDRPVGADPRLPARDHLRAGPARGRRGPHRRVGFELLRRRTPTSSAPSTGASRRCAGRCRSSPGGGRSRCSSASTSGSRRGSCWPPTASPAPGARRRRCCPSSTADPTAPARAAHGRLLASSSPAYEGTTWRNEVTLRSLELFQGYEPGDYLKLISPTPLLMVVAPNDRLVRRRAGRAAYETAAEPKKLVLVPGGHFDAYVGPRLRDLLRRGPRLVRGAPRRGVPGRLPPAHPRLTESTRPPEERWLSWASRTSPSA